MAIDILLLTVAVGLGLAIRVSVLGESLWVDELHTSWAASGPWSDVASRAMQGNQSPLFFYLAWYAVRLFGQHEWVLRLPSLIAGLLLIAGVYVWCWKSTRDRGLSFFAALLVAFDTTFVIFSTEARPYALAQLVGLAHVALTWKCLERPTIFARVAMIVIGALLFYLHYTMVLLFAAEVVWLFCRRGARSDPWHWKCWFSFALLGLLCLPAVPHVFHVFERRDAWRTFVAPPHSWSEIFTALHACRFVMLPWAALILDRLIARGGATFPASEQRRHMKLVVCWWLVPVAVAWLLTTTDIARLFFQRYMIVAAAAPIILSALLWHQLRRASGPRPSWRWAGGLATLALTLYLGGYYQWLIQHQASRFARGEDWRSLVADFQARANDHYPLLIHTGLVEAKDVEDLRDEKLREYLRYPVSGMYQVERNERRVEPIANFGPRRIPREVRQLVQNEGGLWLIVRDRPPRSERLIRAIIPELLLPGQECVVEYRASFPGVQLLRARLE